MERKQPDQDTIRAAVALACRAPSVHNTQPWRWRIGDRTVHLYADRTRAVPATDPTGADLLLGCGAALHHLRIALAGLGWRAIVHRLPNPAEPDHLAAVEFARHEPTEAEVAMAAAIPRRRTDRRHYSSWDVPRAVSLLLEERAAEEGVVLREVTGSRDRFELAAVIGQAAAWQDANPAYRWELRQWSGGHAGSDGVPAANAPAGVRQHGDLRLREFPGGELVDRLPGEGEEDGAALLVLGTSSDDRLSVLRAGEALSAVLLEATGAGLASCPLSQPFEVVTTRDRFRDEVLDGSLWPQILVRVGWAAFGADPLPPTPRRPVREVVEELQKS
ncbi:Acg family FMN-binding oxidoreductase [Saccharothrix longispora]|uniref:Acg family FMN-binding oxidoreductase n=1 Tax=Saccharothrix longispora TaxID=33920 RepID=UPI0028FDA2AC|nr:NAD(P)H nitroreductase [Saccharothrix longispora]MDU0292333.1 NAD(P)H nitroreductase [Saccharothrix longispora]